jgi:hypothetical protein
VEFLEGEDHGVRVGRLHLVDVVEVADDLLRTLVQTIVAEHDIICGQFPRRHHARLVRKHDALAQLDFDAQRIFLPLPAFGEFAARRVGG